MNREEKEGSSQINNNEYKSMERTTNFENNNSRYKKEPKKDPSRNNIFRGHTKEMQGHVFLVFNDRENKQRFSKRVEMLQEYAMKELEYGSDMNLLLSDLKTPELPDPPDKPIGKTSEARLEIWKRRIYMYAEREMRLEENLKKVFVVIWGQCSDTMRAKVAAINNYETETNKTNCVMTF